MLPTSETFNTEYPLLSSITLPSIGFLNVLKSSICVLVPSGLIKIPEVAIRLSPG